MANVWTSKIVTDVLKAIDVKLDKFRKNVLSDVQNTPILPDQIPPSVGSRLSLENNDGINLRVSQIYADVDGMNAVVDNVAEIVLEPGKLESIVKTTIFDDAGYKELSSTTTNTANRLTTVQTKTEEIDGEVTTISNWSNYEDGVLTLGTNNTESSIYKNTLSNDRWIIWEGEKEMISAIRNKVTSPRFQVTDSLIAGNTAIRVGADKHVRWLRYGK